MTDNEIRQMIIKNWGTLHECPACGETALSINLDGNENCLMCGYQYEPEDEEADDWFCYECDQQFASEYEFNLHIGERASTSWYDPPESYCIMQDDDTRYDNWKDNQCRT